MMHSTASPHVRSVPPDPHVQPPRPEPEPEPRLDGSEPPLEDDASSNAGPDFEALKGKAQHAIESSSAWIRENPAAAIGIAVASGFLVGRMLRK